MPWRDLDADDDLKDWEDPDADLDDDEESETVPCPHCLRPIHEDTPRCPECGAYLSTLDAPSRHPWWVVVGVLVCLALVLGWVVW